MAAVRRAVRGAGAATLAGAGSRTGAPWPAAQQLLRQLLTPRPRGTARRAPPPWMMAGAGDGGAAQPAWRAWPCAALRGRQQLGWARARARGYGALRPQRDDDVDGAREERPEARGDGAGSETRVHVAARDAECGPSAPDASASRRRGRSIGERGRLRTRSTGRRPDQRSSAERAGQARAQVARAGQEARQSRSRRAQTDWEEVEERSPRPYALWGVIGANCLVYLMWQDTSMRRFMGKHFAVSSAGVLKEGRVHTLVTSLFSHYDPLHLGANMCSLYFFGRQLVPVLGATRLVAMFVGAGVTASIVQVAWPRIAPAQLRYSEYQLGLGARCVFRRIVVCGCGVWVWCGGVVWCGVGSQRFALRGCEVRAVTVARAHARARTDTHTHV